MNPGKPETSGVRYTVADEQPKDHVVWSIFNLVHFNPCCLGLVALIYSIRARDRKWVGDVEGARTYSKSARCYNIWATALGAVVFVIGVVILAVRLSTMYSH
ncbi:interferon-induced transmembrane protein 3-like [Antennarius striatus]|uniref:interferon-induced transmembrane protein 3-like n=1 Tax=Antennarius striatus TaxID=241820 RepID=UPI0035B1DBF1